MNCSSGSFPGRFSEEEKTKMSYDKETAYQLAFKPSLKLLDGLDDFLAKASQQKYSDGDRFGGHYL
jgi:hypothetical protein